MLAFVCLLVTDDVKTQIGLPNDRRKAPLLCVMEPFMASNQLIVTPSVCANRYSRLLAHCPSVSWSSSSTTLFGCEALSASCSLPCLTDGTQPILNADEVASLFSHPLKGFISSETPFTEPGSLEVPYHSYRDYPTMPGPDGVVRQLRTHQFLTGREAGGTKPVFGLTASVNFLSSSSTTC